MSGAGSAMPETETIPRTSLRGSLSPVISARCPPAEAPRTNTGFPAADASCGIPSHATNLRAAARQSSPISGHGAAGARR